MKVLFKMTVGQARALGFNPESRSRDLESFYTKGCNYRAVYIDKDFLSTEEVELAKAASETHPHMNVPKAYMKYTGYYDPASDRISVPAGHNGAFYTTCAGNCAGWSPLLNGVLVDATRTASKVHFGEVLDFAKGNKIKFEYINTAGPKDMFPWETREDYILRKEEVSDIRIVEARQARASGNTVLARELMMVL